MFDPRTIDPKKVHEAMQDAPNDGKDFRQARAAIRAVLKHLFGEQSPEYRHLVAETLQGEDQ